MKGAINNIYLYIYIYISLILSLLYSCHRPFVIINFTTISTWALFSISTYHLAFSLIPMKESHVKWYQMRCKVARASIFQKFIAVNIFINIHINFEELYKIRSTHNKLSFNNYTNKPKLFYLLYVYFYIYKSASFCQYPVWHK